jgi:aquaporin Z
LSQQKGDGGESQALKSPSAEEEKDRHHQKPEEQKGRPRPGIRVPFSDIFHIHWPEYLCEALGTFVLLSVGFSILAVFLTPFGGPQIMSLSFNVRLLLLAIPFAGLGSLYAVLPPGKLSGAHLNPSLSVAFALLGKMHKRDLAGYIGGQFVGGLAGAWLFFYVWDHGLADKHFAVTAPGPGYTVPEAFATEVVLTFLLISLVLVMVSSKRTMKFTPLVAWILVIFEVWFGAPVSGSSMNPARSFGPAYATHFWNAQWIYFTAPILGAVLAYSAFRFKMWGDLELFTAKLFHSPKYRCIFKNCTVCGRDHSSQVRREDREALTYKKNDGKD